MIPRVLSRCTVFCRTTHFFNVSVTHREKSHKTSFRCILCQFTVYEITQLLRAATNQAVIHSYTVFCPGVPISVERHNFKRVRNTSRKNPLNGTLTNFPPVDGIVNGIGSSCNNPSGEMPFSVPVYRLLSNGANVLAIPREKNPQNGVPVPGSFFAS